MFKRGLGLRPTISAAAGEPRYSLAYRCIIIAALFGSGVLYGACEQNSSRVDRCISTFNLSLLVYIERIACHYSSNTSVLLAHSPHNQESISHRRPVSPQRAKRHSRAFPRRRHPPGRPGGHFASTHAPRYVAIETNFSLRVPSLDCSRQIVSRSISSPPGQARNKFEPH